MTEARDTAQEVFRLRSEGKEVPAELSASLERLDRQVLLPIRAAFGLDACHRAFSGPRRSPPPSWSSWRAWDCRCTRCGD
ncbi:hypothetical protein NKH77_50680 [Streptomyces sp. M19]